MESMVTTFILCALRISLQRNSAFVAVLGLALVSASAFSLELKPGKWGITSETASPMSAEPASQYSEECIEDGNFDPLAEMMQSGMAQQCKLTTHTNSATTLDADLDCAIPGAGSMTGKITFNVAGESASGGMNMSMDMGGQQLQMSSKWNGKYLGACS